jgi:hypothetical protein
MTGYAMGTLATCATWQASGNWAEVPILMVPGERIELPTNGLQNRCSTAELTRHSVVGAVS